MNPNQQPAAATPQLSRNEGASRYEAKVGDQLAGFVEYRQQGDRVNMTHTEVARDFEGQGIGARLAAFALDDVRSRGLKVVPQCSFIASYIERHAKDYSELMAS